MLRNAGFNHDLNLSFDGSGGSMRYFVLANYNSNRGFLDNTDLNDGYSTQVEMYSSSCVRISRPRSRKPRLHG